MAHVTLDQLIYQYISYCQLYPNISQLWVNPNVSQSVTKSKILMLKIQSHEKSIKSHGKSVSTEEANTCFIIFIYPIGSMYGIYANIWGILMGHVTIYSIHGSYGYVDFWVFTLNFSKNHRVVMADRSCLKHWTHWTPLAGHLKRERGRVAACQVSRCFWAIFTRGSVFF